jgi:hypothetical protein
VGGIAAMFPAGRLPEQRAESAWNPPSAGWLPAP